MKADLNKIQNVKEPDEIYFEVDGKEIEFRFDMGTMIELEEFTGEHYYNTLVKVKPGQLPPTKVLRDILYSGLKRRCKKLTIEKVEEMVSLFNYREVCDLVTKSITRNMPTGKDELPEVEEKKEKGSIPGRAAKN